MSFYARERHNFVTCCKMMTMMSNAHAKMVNLQELQDMSVNITNLRQSKAIALIRKRSSSICVSQSSRRARETIPVTRHSLTRRRKLAKKKYATTQRQIAASVVYSFCFFFLHRVAFVVRLIILRCT